MPRNNSKRYFSSNGNSQQPSRGGFGHARGRRNFSNSSSTSRRPLGQQEQQQQQQQQQQPVAAPAAKPKPTVSSPLERPYTDDQYSNVCTQPGSREEAEAQMAYWEDQATSHFNNKKKFEDLYNQAIDKLAARPEEPIAKTAIAESVKAALKERAAKRRKVEEEEGEEKEKEE
ncbi:hypothetical protein H9Q69_013118 [Fusarium xylarioides]|nr:hypothetical protein H9Q69_013118 [Fusarium xylarioides]